jgi:arylsulfatase A-like enzyme
VDPYSSSQNANVSPPNVLLITLDQFRADAMSCAHHPLVQTPSLDFLAANGVRLENHFAQAAPCAPGRAALYTGTYQFNNRVVSNGTPLDHRFDNVALMARRRGYEPILFGYTDQAIDPASTDDPGDPRLQTYEGILPGFDSGLDLTQEHRPWLEWLKTRGFEGEDVESVGKALSTENRRAAEYSLSSFLTDHLLAYLHSQPSESWFVHASFLRPHPPFRAAGEFSTMYDPESIESPIQTRHGVHPLVDEMLSSKYMGAPQEESRMRRIQAQYYGMVSEVDAQLGRIWDALRASGDWEKTVIIVTADHGEHLGDHGLLNKGGFFEQSYRILGLVRDPSKSGTHGSTVKQFTENVDLFPTLAELLGAEVPRQCDGESLLPFLVGDFEDSEQIWRSSAHYEFDWREELLRRDSDTPEWLLSECNLAAQIDDRYAYVQFGDGSWRCFDLVADPTWGIAVEDPAIALRLAQEMLVWRSKHTDKSHTSTLLGNG